MDDQPEPVDFMYVEADIPAGMTITAWRAQQSVSRRSRLRRLWLRARRRRTRTAPLTP